jgi:HAMP domain-containing protein
VESAHDPVEPPSAGQRRDLSASDNPLVRTIARVPLPIGAKQFFCTLVVAALLAIVAVLGVVALGQSNSRSAELRRLQGQAVYEQLLLSDANQLKKAIDYRLALASWTTEFGSGLDQTITNEMSQLCEDAGISGCLVGGTATPHELRLGAIDPALLVFLESHVKLFYPFYATQTQIGSAIPTLRRADKFAGSFAARVGPLAKRTRARTNVLVAADHASFTSSRDLLIGVGAASIVLALGLGLLLSWSVVAPLRRIRGQLAAIAGGDFAGHADVANRDEIGALAADVNEMSDELQRAYRELELASEHKSEFPGHDVP